MAPVMRKRVVDSINYTCYSELVPDVQEDEIILWTHTTERGVRVILHSRELIFKVLFPQQCANMHTPCGTFTLQPLSHECGQH
eukprot:5544170-Amphidinium_carterae.1